MTTKQRALLLDKPKGTFTVGLVDVPEPGPGEVQIRIHVAALNPADWIVADLGIILTEWPAILGYDAAGVVTKLGEGVTHLSAGDRVYVQTACLRLFKC